jgi:hypothetical protein
VVVNPPSQQQQTPESDKGPKIPEQPLPGKGKGKSGLSSSLADVTTSSGAIAIGPSGLMVSGNYTRVEGGQGYSHNPYGTGSFGNRGGHSNRGNYGSGNYGSGNYGGWGSDSYNDYYMNRYRPVYRSRYGYNGYGAYWGYYGRPYRVIRGGYCYYVYPRPVSNCGAYCTPRYYR